MIDHVEIIDSECGDWSVLRVNGENYYSGHSIPSFIWQELLEKFGIFTTVQEITSKSMEEGNY